VANNGTIVFPLFPTLLELIKKRAAPYPHAITTSEIYYTVVAPCLFPPWFNLSAIQLRQFSTVLPRGRNFGRKPQKGPLKNLRAGKTCGRIFNKFAKKGPEKGPNFCKPLFSGIICGSSEMNAFLSQLYPHILPQFVSFQQIFFLSKKKFKKI
jgi:hypothetical protein